MNVITFDWKDQFRYDYQHIRQDHVDEIICWIKKYIIGPLPPKEPNDERSVARDDHQCGEAGNKKQTTDVEQAAEDYTRKYNSFNPSIYYAFIAGAKWQGKEAGETVKGDDLEDKLCRMYDLWVVEKRQSFRSAVKEFIKNEYANQFKTNKND